MQEKLTGSHHLAQSQSTWGFLVILAQDLTTLSKPADVKGRGCCGFPQGWWPPGKLKSHHQFTRNKEKPALHPQGLLGTGCLRNGAKQGWLHVKCRLWVTAIHPWSFQYPGKCQGGKGYSGILLWIALGTNPALIFNTYSANDLNKLRKARAHILTALFGRFLPLLPR